MKEFKFRAWDKKTLEIPPSMYYFDFSTAHQFLRCGNIMQCTGGFDMNDVEVYRGDILRGLGLIVECVYSAEDCAYLLKSKTGSAFMNESYLKNFEVIGNIYKDKELLDG